MNANEENLTVTDEDFAAAREAMAKAGARGGKASGGWIADGNTSEASLRALLKAWEDGDPAAPYAPDPFSGEWAGDPTANEVIDRETDLDAETLEPEEADDLATAYEDAFRAAWQDEAERTVRGMLS